MSEEIYLKLLYSFTVGGIGSAAYITALYFRFVGETKETRRIVIEPFLKRYSDVASVPKCFWYCLIGGFIAVIFQFDVPNFVAVQSLILGATWPAIVSQFLSGRMTHPNPREIDEFINENTSQKDNTDAWKKILDEIKNIKL